MNIRLPLRTKKGGQSKEGKELYLDSLRGFAEDMKAIQETIDFHMSSRGWCYVLEPMGLNKGDFDWAQKQIDQARREGFLKPGFILEEEGHEVESISDYEASPEDYVEYQYARWKESEQVFRDSWKEYDEVSFWDDKPYYIQLLVEKSDLKSLFRVICEKYRINMANMRGWGSMEQKAAMATNFKRMERQGKVPVLLACGDHDPPGLCISDVLHKQFKEYSLFSGWDPENLIVDRVGLNYNFIQENGLTWIDGLTTISGKDLSDPEHKFFKRNTYDIQGYIKKYGKQKCEANAVVIVPELGRRMLEDTIARYIGADAHERYEILIAEKKAEAKELITDLLENDIG